MAHQQLADASLQLGNLEAAERACREALSLKPDYLDALITLGQVLMRQSRYVDAREVFLDYLHVRDCYDESKELRGFILLHLDSWHEAYYGLGLVAEALGDPATALEWYRRVLESKSRYLDTHARIGRLCYELGRHEQAREAFEAELVSDPDSFWPHFCLGDIGMRCGRWQEAMEHYQSALQLEPQHATLHFNIAACACQLGRVELAQEHLGMVDHVAFRVPAALQPGDELFRLSASYPVIRHEDAVAINCRNLLSLNPVGLPAKKTSSAFSAT
jgi:tetratricopeptide (TPR) repeat protein